MLTKPASIIFATLCVLFNTAVFAGGYDIEPAEPQKRWAFGAEGLYLFTTMPSITYAQTISPTVRPEESFAIKAKDDFAFRIEGSFYIDDRTDITANWLQLHGTQTNSANATNNSFPNLIVLDPTLDLSPLLTSADAQLKTEFDVVNVELGRQALLFADNPNLSTRLHLGIQYARLKNDLSTVGNNSQDNTNASVTSSQSFSGVGPRGGMDIQYNLGSGFSIIGKAAGSVLIGDFKWRAHSANNVPVIEDSSFNQKNTITVPAIDGRIGAQYAHSISSLDFIVEGGFQAARYFDIMRTSDFRADNVGTQHSYGYYGPYLGLKVVG